jgi:hypothetical protein
MPAARDIHSAAVQGAKAALADQRLRLDGQCSPVAHALLHLGPFSTVLREWLLTIFIHFWSLRREEAREMSNEVQAQLNANKRSMVLFATL